MKKDNNKQVDILRPRFKTPETDNYYIGRFGRAYLRHIKQHRKSLYAQLKLEGKLVKHVAEIDKQAQQMYEDILRERVFDAPDRDNQMEWVRFMNNLRSSAEEIVFNEIIYPDERPRVEERER